MSTTVPEILVAEDSLVVRAVLRKHLEEHGYAVREADNGHAALRECRTERPDVVLLDVEMPGLDGHQVLRALKADADLADIPVVFLTGLSSTEDLVEGLRLGAHDYLKKPFEASELIARISSAVRVKSLQDELRARNVDLDQMSRTDALTGLYNRRHIDERMSEFASSGRRRPLDLAVLMLDVDHFKRVNDTVGHAGGDAVLRELSARLRAALRAEDIAGRWGGEEFVVLMPHTVAADANTVGERVRQAMGAKPFLLEDGQDLPVTVSVGVAAGAAVDGEQLVHRADSALYLAKEQGRDRVIVHGA